MKKNYPDELKSIRATYWSDGPKDESRNEWQILTGKYNSRWSALNPANMEAPCWS